jgi:hypothetical protein
MPVPRGNRPDIVDACPGAVSVTAWSWYARVNTAPPFHSRPSPPVSCPGQRVK